MKSQVGKYIPGKIGLLITKVVESTRYGVSTTNAFVASSYEIGIELYILILVTTITFPALLQHGANLKDQTLIVSVFILFMSGILLYPANFFYIVNKLLKALKRNPLQMDIEAGPFVAISLLMILATLMSGLAGYATIRLYHDLDIRLLAYLICARNIAFLLGFINVLIPSGIGVREGILVWLLTYILPAPLALLVTITLRTLGTAVEWVMIGFSFLIRR